MSLPLPLTSCIQAIETGDAPLYAQWLADQVATLPSPSTLGQATRLRMTDPELALQKALGEQLPAIVQHRALFVLEAWAAHASSKWQYQPNHKVAEALVLAALRADDALVKPLLGRVAPEEKPQHALDFTWTMLFEQTDSPDAVKKLLAWGADPIPDARSNPPLFLAAKHSRTRSLLALLPVTNPWKHGGRALYSALAQQNQTMVDALLPLSDPNHLAEGLSRAAETNNVNLLNQVHVACRAYAALPLAAPLQTAFEAAAASDAMETLKYLLPHANPHAEGGAALRKALQAGADQAVIFLVDKTDLTAVQQRLVSSKDIPLLAKLMPWVPIATAESWATSYGSKHPTLLATLRTLQAHQETPAATTRRHRPRS